MKNKKYLKFYSYLLFIISIGFLSLSCAASQIRIGQNLYNLDDNKPCAKNAYNENNAYITWVKYENLPYDTAYNVAFQSINELSLSELVSGKIMANIITANIIFNDKTLGVIVLTNKLIPKKTRSRRVIGAPDIFFSTTTIIIRKNGNGSVIEIRKVGGKVIGTDPVNCTFFEIMDRRLNKKL